MLLTVLFIALGAIGYFQVGYHLGDIGVKKWLAGDNDSLASFLLFPVSHHKKRVGELGEKSLAIIGGFDLKKEAPTSFGPEGYKFLTMLIWPLKILINLPAYVLYGAIDGVSAGAKTLHASRATALEDQRRLQEASLTPSAADDVRTLFDKRQAVVNEIQMLGFRKEAIDAELEARKAEMDAILEVEGSVDPEIRRLASGDRAKSPT